MGACEGNQSVKPTELYIKDLVKDGGVRARNKVLGVGWDVTHTDQ